MKQPLNDQNELRMQAAEQLAEVMISMQAGSECLALLKDLCTPAELEAIADRWRVVLLLKQGMHYRAIHEATGVSVTTVGRVARFLQDGAGGYEIALKILNQ